MTEIATTSRFVPATRLPESFTSAFEDLYTHAYRAAYRLIGIHQDSEDVAEEACAQACLRWDRLTRDGAADPWVILSTTHLAIDQYRERARTRAREGVPGLAQTLDRRRVELHRALDQLTPRLRDVVVLRYVVDLSEADTAAALGCTTDTVKSQGARGLALLRYALGEDDAP